MPNFQAGGSFQISKTDFSRAFEDKGVVIIGKSDRPLSLDEVRAANKMFQLGKSRRSFLS